MSNIVNTVVELSGAPGTTDTNGTDFDLLREAVLAAGLDGALSDPAAALTVFAPNDNAFIGLAQTLGYGDADEGGALGYILDALTLLGGGDPIPLLQQVLTYHVTAAGALTLADVAGLGDGAVIPTLQGGTLTLDLTAPGLIDADDGLPNPNLIGFDVDGGNGIIHVLDGVLIPLSVTGILSQPDTDFKIGGDGDDYYFVGAGNDFVDGNGGNDIIWSGSGDDVSIGGAGNDVIGGGSGNDILLGEDGRDYIYGGSGNDVINGGAGRDIMWSGRGEDTFVFENGSGRDLVFWFSDGNDMIDLSGYAGIESFDDVEVSQGFFGTRLTFEGDDTVFLFGTRASAIDEDDFIFAGDAIA